MGCSSESPRDKAKRYIGYIDSFYVSLTDQQEKAQGYSRLLF